MIERLEHVRIWTTLLGGLATLIVALTLGVGAVVASDDSSGSIWCGTSDAVYTWAGSDMHGGPGFPPNGEYHHWLDELLQWQESWCTING